MDNNVYGQTDIKSSLESAATFYHYTPETFCITVSVNLFPTWALADMHKNFIIPSSDRDIFLILYNEQNKYVLFLYYLVGIVIMGY